MQDLLFHKVKLFSATAPVATTGFAEVVVGDEGRLLSKTHIEYGSDVIVWVSCDANAIAIANVDGSSKARPVGEVNLGNLWLDCQAHPGKVQNWSLSGKLVCACLL